MEIIYLESLEELTQGSNGNDYDACYARGTYYQMDWVLMMVMGIAFKFGAALLGKCLDLIKLPALQTIANTLQFFLWDE